MRPAVTLKRAAVAAAAGLLAAGAAACSGTSVSPAAGGAPAGSPAAGGSAFPDEDDSPGPSSASPPSLPACALLTEADVIAVAATFKHVKVTVTAHEHSSDPPENSCGFNQKGVFHRDGMTDTLSGDRWAKVTVIPNGVDYAFQPAGMAAISGLGNGAYWEKGTHQVVVRVGRNVLQVSDEVPVDPADFPDLTTAYRQAALALAVKIVSRL